VLGRVTAAYRLFGYGALPLGSLVGGVAAHLFGVAIVFPIGAVISGLALVGLPFVREQLLKAAEAESARVE
jgi:ABC-type molybdate transport system permease subunit